MMLITLSVKAIMLGLKAKLVQIRNQWATQKTAQLQQRTERLAYLLYLQRTKTNHPGCRDSDWAKAQRIAKNPLKNSLCRANFLQRKALTPARWFVNGLSGKTSWEWLELFIVPLFLAIGAFYLDNGVEQRQERIAAERYEQEASIADDRARQEILDSYLEKMQELLLDRDLRESSENIESFVIARAITATAIKGLDSERNHLLVVFLREADLLGVSGSASSTEERGGGIALFEGLDLSDAELSWTYLVATNLNYTDLSFASLSSAKLSYAKLRGTGLGLANLYSADLSYANLSEADLSEANLRSANLRSANLSSTDLRSARNVTKAQLSEALLCNTILPEGIDLDPSRDCEELYPLY